MHDGQTGKTLAPDKSVSIEHLTVDSEGPRFESCSGPSLSLRSHYTTNKSLPHLCVCVACHTYDIVLSLVYIIFAHVHTQVHGYTYMYKCMINLNQCT